MILCVFCISSFVCKLPCVFSGTSTWPFVARHRTQRKRWSSWQRPQPPGQQRIGGSSPILRILGGLFPDVRVISMFGFWERAVSCMDISDVIYIYIVMRSSEFLDVEPETWPRYFCQALRGFLGSSLLCKQRVAICWNAGFASRGTRNKQSRQTSTVPVFRLILCTRFCAWTKGRFRSIHPKSLHKMQLYNLPTDFSIVVFRDIATGKRRIIGYFTWKQLSPWAMEVCNPSFLPFSAKTKWKSQNPKPVFFPSKFLLRRRQSAWEAWGANLLLCGLAIHHQTSCQQLSAVQVDPPGFLVRRLVIPGLLARCPMWKKNVDSWRWEDFNGVFVCDVFLQCCVFAEKMPVFNDVSGDRASHRRPLKFQV